MAQDRLERLMNVVAYLSNTLKPVTLREIIETVPGYPDSFEAARRAFERDKEQLRSMNLDIVHETTPDGYSGYRIRKESTYYDFQLSPQQRSIVEYALNLYGPEQSSSQRAITYLGGMNPENILGEITSLPMPEIVDDLFDVMSQNKSLIIEFRGEERNIIPRQLIARSGYWYLSAFDMNKNEPRTFRVDRIDRFTISTVIENIPDEDTYESIDEEKQSIKLKVHPILFTQFCEVWNGTVLSQDDCIVSIEVSNPKIFLSYLFEYSGFVSVISPQELVTQVAGLFNATIEELKA